MKYLRWAWRWRPFSQEGKRPAWVYEPWAKVNLALHVFYALKFLVQHKTLEELRDHYRVSAAQWGLEK